MSELAIILKRKGLGIEQADSSMITFDGCPLCNTGVYQAHLNALGFTCPACISESLQEFLSRYNVKYDNSPTDLTELLEKNIDPLFDPENVKGTSTGYSNLDKAIGGLKPQRLIILAAETGMGKSVFGINLFVNTDAKCSYFDLENGKHASLNRFISIKGMLPTSVFENPDNITSVIATGEKLKGKITYRDQSKLNEVIGDLRGKPMAEVIGGLIRSDVEAGCKLFLIDPLENFEVDDKSYVSIGSVIEYFKDLAQQLNITIIILHHVKKPTTANSNMVNELHETSTTRYRIPTIHDLTGASKISNKATDVWVLVRQKEDQNEAKRGRILLRILKGRFNQNGDLYFMMNLNNLKIAEVDLLR